MKNKKVRNVANIIALAITIIVLIWLSLKLMIPAFMPHAFAASNDTVEVLSEDISSAPAVSPIAFESLEVQKVELDNLNNYIMVSISNLDVLLNEIETLHQNVLQAKVCSKANRFFNSLEEKYNEFLALLDHTKLYNVSYEEKYSKFLADVEVYNAFTGNPDEKYSVSVTSPVEIKFSFNAISNAQKLQFLDKIYSDSKLFADKFFEKDYHWACVAAQNEAGYEHWPAEERYYVLGVAEHRVESDNYPNSLKDVFSQPGQYPWVARGCVNIPVSETTKKDVELYLRGRVDIEMPTNVIYQSKEKLGNVWYYSSISGHYFCSPYGS